VRCRDVAGNCGCRVSLRAIVGEEASSTGALHHGEIRELLERCSSFTGRLRSAMPPVLSGTVVERSRALCRSPEPPSARCVESGRKRPSRPGPGTAREDLRKVELG